MYMPYKESVITSKIPLSY